MRRVAIIALLGPTWLLLRIHRHRTDLLAARLMRLAARIGGPGIRQGTALSICADRIEGKRAWPNKHWRSHAQESDHAAP